MRSVPYLLAFFLIFLWSPLARANGENDALTSREMLSTTRGLALGNAMSASASGTSAIWHNPAGITSAIMYSFDAAYIYRHQDDSHGFETNLVDMKSNAYVGAALGFAYQHANPNNLSQHMLDVRLGLAVPLADNLLSIGVAGLYNFIQLDGKKTLSQLSMDVGLLIRPLEWLTLGVAAQNLFVGDHADTMPRMIAAGISAGSLELAFNVMFEASFNLSADDIANSGSYGVGVEYVLKKFIPIRLGYRYEMGDGDHHVLTAGLGYRHQGGIFGLDLAYQHHFADFSNEVFSGSLDFYF